MIEEVTLSAMPNAKLRAATHTISRHRGRREGWRASLFGTCVAGMVRNPAIRRAIEANGTRQTMVAALGALNCCSVSQTMLQTTNEAAYARAIFVGSMHP